MFKYVGILRDRKGLETALSSLQEIKIELLPKMFARDMRQLKEAFEVKNMVTVSEIVTRAALFRKESRGDHYRMDFPQRDDDKWLKNILISKKGNEIKIKSQPAPITRLYPSN